MELTERAKWLTEFFQTRASEWVEISTDELIEEYRKAFPEESPTPGYIFSQLEALEQMGMITIDRPEFGQKKPTRYIWSGGGAIPAVAEPAAPVVEEEAEMATVTVDITPESAYVVQAQAPEQAAALTAEPMGASSYEETAQTEPAAAELADVTAEPIPEPIAVVSSEPVPEAAPSAPAEPAATMAAPTTSSCGSISCDEAERKLASLEETVRLIRSQLETFEGVAEDLRCYIAEQGEIIERQVILDEPGLDYRMETVKVKKKG